VNVTLHTAIEYLSRVSVFIEHARIGEDLPNFENGFEQVEDNSEAGLYWLLCTLHIVIHAKGITINQEVIDSVMSISVMEVDRNALRHYRDYLVLKDFERLLDLLAIEFAALRNLHPAV